MTYFLVEKNPYLGINLIPSHPYWVLLHKNRQQIQIISHGQSHPTEKHIPKCRKVYTAIADQHLIQRALDFAQPLNDEQVILQLELDAQNLFGLPWEALAIDCYRSTSQQIITVAAPQTEIKKITTHLSRYNIEPTAIEPANQALNRLIKFCGLNTSPFNETTANIKQNYQYILQKFDYQGELKSPDGNDATQFSLALGLEIFKSPTSLLEVTH